MKAACTDALKAAAERIGSCFRPLTDLELQAHIKRETFRATSSPPPDAATAMAELYDDVEPTTPQPVSTSAEAQATASLPVADARREFYALSGPAIAQDRISAQAVNDLVRQANGSSWADALAALKAQLA